MILASIPSPPLNSFHFGSLQIHIYGILMGLAVATAYLVTVRRYVRFGGDREVVERAAFWAVVGGFMGARLAYVSTHLYRYRGDWLGVFKVWEGGLALFGGLTLGAAAAAFVLWRSRGKFLLMADAAAVGLPLAQAIGRWGNYFNQELFGTPTRLPWGLEIDAAHRPAQYADSPTFHPTFLYESLWSVGVVLFLLWLERRRQLRRGTLFATYLVLYAAARFSLELIRTDTTFRLLGISRNGWVALGAMLLGAGLLAVVHRRPAPTSTGEEAVAAEGSAEEEASVPSLSRQDG
jgi:prolipoprotein diacylglyceryl transferase